MKSQPPKCLRFRARSGLMAKIMSSRLRFYLISYLHRETLDGAAMMWIVAPFWFPIPVCLARRFCGLRLEGDIFGAVYIGKHPIVTKHTCRLCNSFGKTRFFQDRQRSYFRCQTCHLVFVLPAQFLPADAEKAEYDLHQNSPHDERYRQFLSRLFNPVQARLASASHGLDFGSGPGPTLSVMFEEAGHTVAIYDRFYAVDPAVLTQQYDFITASEVVEHLHQPGQTLDRLWGCLRPGGILGIMTKLVVDEQAFARWHYRNDLTHVCFFSRSTFRWLADRWQAELSFVGDDVILLVKNVD